MEEIGELQRAVSIIIEAGYQIDKEAFDFLKEISHTADLEMVIDAIIREINKLPEKPLLINREMIEEKVKDLIGLPEKEALQPPQPTIIPEERRKIFRAYAKEVDAEIKVIENPTDNIGTDGSLKDYIKYFQDRFQRIRSILRRRMDVADSVTIMEATRSSSKSKLKILCLVAEKRESKRGVFLQVEDLEASAMVFVPSENHQVVEKARRLVLDQVICICAVKGKNNFLIADDLILPDVPMRKPNRAPMPVYAALISDLHVGSKMFMEKVFQNFLLWLKGKIGNSNLRNIASHVKYVVIAGDIVDGVGIYPQQIEELEIKDIYKQYEAAARMIEQIPEYIEVIILPGNHDASRKALPQPAIQMEYAEPLYEARKIHSLGDPSTISLHGVEALLFHGRSLDDIISTIPNMSFEAPEEAMKLLLQSRHLAPIYGSRTPIAPERIDYLVIKRIPDIFHAGHVHMMRYNTYRGVLIVNSGAWQGQTEYQKEMGHIPNPGIAPIVNLQSLEVTPINFASLSSLF